MSDRLPDPEAIGTLDRDSLADALRPLWEDAGPLADAMSGRSFPTWDAVLDACDAAIAGMDGATLAELLTAHPRIGADPASLSEASRREQGRSEDPAVIARLDQLNHAYEDRFGFPFVEWVAGRPKSAIIGVLERRLERDRSTELAAGAAALAAIARDRLARLRSAAP